jgi:hypothetical protein
METLSMNYESLDRILKNMQIIPPNVNEYKLYSEHCVGLEIKLLEQQIILQKWQNESAFTVV